VHQNPSPADNPFAAKNQNCIFLVDESGLIFEKYLVANYIWTTNIQMTK